MEMDFASVAYEIIALNRFQIPSCKIKKLSGFVCGTSVTSCYAETSLNVLTVTSEATRVSQNNYITIRKNE